MADEDIEEIILDVFVAIWKNTEKLDGERDIKPYLASIAHNLTKKKLSEISKNTNLVEIDEEKEYSKENWSNTIENRLKIEEIDYILKELSEEEYSIFTNFYYYSKKTKEIAKKLNISDVKVKTKLHRIRNKIKKKFKERGYGNEGIK